MSEEVKDFTLLVFKEQTLKDKFNVESDQELYLSLYVPIDGIIDVGKPIPQSAKYKGVYGLVLPSEAFLVHVDGEKRYAIHAMDMGKSFIFEHLTHEIPERDIDALLDNKVHVVVNDLDDPEVMAKLNELDPEALKGIIEDLSDVSEAE